MSDGSTLRAIDANVILRYLLQDVPHQFEAARRLIESRESLGLTSVALAEIAWTLTGPYYRVDRKRVAGLLVAILSRENITTIGFSKEEALAAMQSCATDDAAADFGDALITACARSAGIDEIYSFDNRFARAGLNPITPE
ncbi:MAG: PIN domain-containing protein [Nitrolancea sp.]